MSWDVYLRDQDGKTVDVDSHFEGGIQVLGGNEKANMTVTYNYSPFYREAWQKGFSLTLHGMKASDSIPLLDAAIAQLGDSPDGDYWAKTPGNAGHALTIMRRWAQEHPDAVWTIH